MVTGPFTTKEGIKYFKQGNKIALYRKRAKYKDLHWINPSTYHYKYGKKP